MAYTPTRLYQGQPGITEATATPGILNAAVPSSTTWILKEILLCNISTTQAVTISLSVVPSSGTGGTSNRILNTVSLAASETKSFGLSTVMTTGDFLTAVASAGSTITLTISGVVIT